MMQLHNTYCACTN